jgi:hypothetical protein
MLRPVLISTIPMLLLLANLESFYGRSPLAPGQEAVVTMRLKAPLDPNAAAPGLQASSEIDVETPGVREPAAGQVSWRIRGTRAGSGRLDLALADGVVSKSVEVGGGLRYMGNVGSAPSSNISGIPASGCFRVRLWIGSKSGTRPRW